MNLAEAQEWISARCDSPYYAGHYRAMEADYLPTLCKIIEPLTPATAVDVGPGYGTLALWMASRGWGVTLMDFVPVGKYISRLQLHAMRAVTGETIAYAQADICGESLKERCKLVVATQVLPHLKWRPDRAVANIAQMLLPGGRFVCAVLNRQKYPHVQAAFRHWREVPEYRSVNPTPDTVTVMYDEAEVRELLEPHFKTVALHEAPGSTCLFLVCEKE